MAQTVYAILNSGGVVTGYYAGPTSDPNAVAMDDTDPRLVAYQAAQQAAQANAPIIAKAQADLDASDKTLLRCTENGIAVPAEWAAYRKALRAVVKDPTQPYPSRPAYPAGT